MTKLSFKKVQHSGAHQDYRIMAHGQHVGNIRAGFKDSRRRSTSWAARSNVLGFEVVLSAQEGVSRVELARKLLEVIRVLGWRKGQACLCSDVGVGRG